MGPLGVSSGAPTLSKNSLATMVVGSAKGASRKKGEIMVEVWTLSKTGRQRRRQLSTANNSKNKAKRCLATARRILGADRQQANITRIKIKNDAERSGLSWHAIPTAYPWPGLGQTAASAEKAKPEKARGRDCSADS